MIEILPDNLNGVDPSLATMLETAAKYDATCVLNSTLNEYAVWLTCIGIAMGIVFTLAFQYTRKLAKEKIEAAEYARKLKELSEELPDKPE